MFSLMNYFQGLIARLKRNKGLWFSIITTVSIVGIITTMYIIMSMTSGVAQQVYSSMSKEYILRLDGFLEDKKKEFQKITLIALQNEVFLQQIETNNKVALETSLKNLNDLLVKNGINHYKISAFSIADQEAILRTSIVSVIQSKNSVYGVEVMTDGVFNTYLQPIMKENTVYGVFEIKESIHNYRKHFEEINDEYVFLLEKKMLPRLSVDTKNGKFRDMIADLTLAQSFYDTKFSASIVEMEDEDFEQMKLDKFIIDGVYYRTYKVMTDTNGADIGVVMMGEQIDREDGFVNLADNMTKTVTTVALGLVISIMLFMF